jgi:hypothetical protein
MESFRFMASLAADSALETFSSTQERAKELAAASAASLQTASAGSFTSVASGLTSGVACMRATAANASESVASMNLSKLEAGTLVGSCSLFAQAPKLPAQPGSCSAVSGGPGGIGRPNDAKASDEDSESGGEDGGRAVSFLSRLGLQSSRPESQQLLGNGAGRSAAGGAAAAPAAGFGAPSSFGLPASFSSFPSSFASLPGGSMTNLFSPSAPKEPLTLTEKVCEPWVRTVSSCPLLRKQQ